MQVPIKASLILAGLVATFSIVYYLLGLQSSFVVGQAVFLGGAIAINVGVVLWALGKTAAESSYGRQVLNATVIGVAGGLLIVLASWVLLSWLFPNALEESRQAAIEYMRSSGMSDGEFQRQLEVLERTTPMSQSVPGGIGTFFTSVVTGAVFGAFKRKKES